MSRKVKVDFVSDVACPWCAIGLASLERAVDNLKGEVEVELHFQPFELNPQMWEGGQDVSEHLTQKYGTNAEQQAAAREMLRERGAAVGFAFRKEGRGRVYNTFNAHRLLYWAGLEDAAGQHALKKALLETYHGEGRSPADPEVLLDAVRRAGLDVERARSVLSGDDFTREVRELEGHYQQAGIHAVPSVILDDKYLVQGGQPPELFEQALRQAAAQAA